MGSVDLRRFPAPEPLASAAAADWLAAIQQLRSPGTRLGVALSGGRIARAFLAAVTPQVKSNPGSLSGVHFFWSDERCVPPNDPESNFRLAHEAFLEPVGVPLEQIHRVKGELPPTEACAQAESELRSISGTVSGIPILDLVLLGMGEDGHVASLFPGEPADVRLQPAIFRPVTAPKPPPHRITMGYPMLVSARQVWVLASGAGKLPALRDSLEPGGSTPLALVIQQRSVTRIYSDIS